MRGVIAIIVRIVIDLLGWMGLVVRSRRSLEAEVLFLRRQLALYLERGAKPGRIDGATRVSLALLSRLFEWPSALVVVRPETLVRWHRAGFRLFWRWKSRAGRPSIPIELRQLIRRMALENPLWGQERIANELLVKLGLHVSPRTVRKYLPKRPLGRARRDQRWSTFLKNHAQAVVACDFLVAVTASFRLLYILVVIEHRSRRLIHFNVTAHPTAAWACQQMREVFGFDTPYEYLIHDRDSIFSRELDDSIASFGLRVLKTPPHCPMANGFCERLIGTIRRECLDWLIPLSEAHLRRILRLWSQHYNGGRPHMMLGPGLPDPPRRVPTSFPKSRHFLDDFGSIRSKAVLGGLHHEYSLCVSRTQLLRITGMGQGARITNEFGVTKGNFVTDVPCCTRTIKKGRMEFITRYRRAPTAEELVDIVRVQAKGQLKPLSLRQIQRHPMSQA